MDCSVVQTRHKGLVLVSTTDFFYPLVEDPYMQGRIAACNVLSDMYSMGIVDIDTTLMLLGVSLDMTPAERDIVTTRMIQGFNDAAAEAETNVTGGQTVMNPWPVIGGVAESLCGPGEYIMPDGAEPGDVVVLTKPLGTQVAVNAQQWTRVPKWWSKVEHVVTAADVEAAFATASESMSRLNRNGARMMRKYGAHACTDVTGFGLLGHARNLATHSKRRVKLEIHTLPVIRHMARVDAAVNHLFKLADGFSAETSGGLLVCLPAANARDFIDELAALDGQPAWVVGRVLELDDDDAAAAREADESRVDDAKYFDESGDEGAMAAGVAATASSGGAGGGAGGGTKDIYALRADVAYITPDVTILEV